LIIKSSTLHIKIHKKSETTFRSVFLAVNISLSTSSAVGAISKAIVYRKNEPKIARIVIFGKLIKMACG